VYQWQPWLERWNRELLARFDPAEVDAFIDPLVTQAVVDSGWLGYPGVAEAQLVELEARLGTALPPSYRSFLSASNGFLQPGVIVPRLLSADEVAWLRDVDQETIDVWTASGDPDGFERHLPAALQVSARETVGTAMYLLNPKVTSADGEWEAFYFAHWLPGVRRYPSFRALMQTELEDLLAPAPPMPLRRSWTFLDAVRWIFRRDPT
jgi:hypothetical protein